MEEMYMIEFFIQRISLQCKSGKLKTSDKKLTVNLEFGKFASFIVNESEFENDLLPQSSNDPNNPTEDWHVDYKNIRGQEKYTDSTITLASMNPDADELRNGKAFNGGASILFAHNPDGLKQTFKLFPLDISVWTNDDTEKRACVGNTKILWDSEFLELVTVSSKTCRVLPPTTVKTVQKLRSEITGSIIGEMTCLIRLTHLGKKVITCFKVANSRKGFMFRNRTRNASNKCKKYGVNTDLDQLTTIGVIYESLEIDDPDIVKASERKKHVSEELRAAGLDKDCIMFVTGDQLRKTDTNQDKGPFPCGNANCKLTKMIQSYLTQGETLKLGDQKCTEGYQVGGAAKKQGKEGEGGGCCGCNYSEVPEEPTECGAIAADQPKFVICEVCGGYSNTITCKDRESGMGACPGPCYLRTSPAHSNQPPNVERMLFEGLSKMLTGSKSGTCTSFPNTTPPCCKK